MTSSQVLELVERFERNLEAYPSASSGQSSHASYKEARVRVEFIDPALEKAGWDVNNPDQVGIEIPVDGFDPQAWQALAAQLQQIRQAHLKVRPVRSWPTIPAENDSSLQPMLVLGDNNRLGSRFQMRFFKVAGKNETLPF